MLIYMLFIALLILSSCISLVLIIYAVRRHTVPGALTFALMTFGTFIWSSGYLAELLFPGLQAKIAWDNLEFLGSDIIAAGILLFAFEYTGRAIFIRRFAWLLGLVTLLNQIMIWTDPLHHLLRPSAQIETGGLFASLTYTYGPWFWFVAVYDLTLTIGALCLLTAYAIRAQPPYRFQSITVVVALAMPVIGSILTIVGIVPIPSMAHLDIAPITLTISNLILAWALFRHRLIDLAPIARTLLVEQIPDGMIVLDARQRIVDCNPAALRLLGCTAETLIGSDVTSALPLLAAYVDQTDPGLSSAPVLLSATNDRATPVYVAITTTPLLNRRRRLGWLLLLRDITAQQQAEATLRESQALLQGVLDYSPTSIAVLDPAKRFLLVNRRLATMMGLTHPQQVRGKTSAELLPPELVRIGEAEHDRVMQTQAPMIHEVSWQSPDGPHTGLVSTFPLKHPDGTIYAVGSISIDITERKCIEQTLEQYRQIVSMTADSMSLIDTQYVYQVVNQAYLSRYVRTYDEIVGHSVAEVMGSDIFENIIKPHLDRCLAGETVCYQEWFSYPEQGRRFMDVTYTPYRENGDDISGILVSARDITDIKHANEAYRVLVDHSLQGFGIVQDAQVVFTNPAAARITGYTPEEIIAMGVAHLDRIIHPDDRQRLYGYHQARTQGSQSPQNYEYRIISKDGSIRWVDNYSIPIQYQGRPATQVSFIDITERKRIEADLQAAQARLNFLLESSPAVIFSLHPGKDYKATFVSPNITLLTGFQPKDFTGNPTFWISRIHPDDQSAVSRRQYSFASQNYISGEYRFQHRDGSYRWMRDEVRMVSGNDEQPELIGYWIDVTAQHIAEEALAEREATLRAFYDSAPFRMGIVELHDDDIVFVDVNATFAQEFGTTPEAIRGRSARTMIQDIGSNDSYMDPWLRYYRQAWESGQAMRFEIIEYRPDAPAWVSTAIAPISTPANTHPRCCFVTEDITERKRAEYALQESEARYRILARHFPNGTVFLFDRDLRYLVAGGTGLASLGITPEMLEGYTIWECLPPDLCAIAESIYRSILDGTAPPEIEQIYNERTYRTILEPIRDARNMIVAGMIISLDITAQKQIEADLEQRVRERTIELVAANRMLAQQIAERERADTQIHFQASLLDTIGQAVIVFDCDGSIIYWNNYATRLLGWMSDEVIGHDIMSFSSIVQPQDRVKAFAQKMFDGNIHSEEFIAIARDRRTFPIQITVSPITDHTNRITGIISISMDISERKQAEAALARTYAYIDHLNEQLERSNLLLRTLLDHLQSGLGLVDQAGYVLAINQPLARLYSHQPQQIVAQPWSNFCPFSPPLVEQTFLDKQPHYTREHYTDTRGRSYMLDFAVLPVINDAGQVDQAIVHVIDVTERLQLEAQVIAQERFAANGWLAATVAHEVNSPLQAIESCLHMAGRTQGDQHTEYLQLARDEIRRVAHILHQLLNLYRPESSIDAVININRLIERELLLLGSTLAKQGISVEQDLGADLPDLWGRADELMQVLLNLIINAMHAMPHGGHLCIQTFLKHPDDSLDLPDQRLVIMITDTGLGIPPDLQERIFEPFFTTKAKGSGLGLTISAKIIAAHRGQIYCHSTANSGTTFVLEFPPEKSDMPRHNDRTPFMSYEG